MRTRGILLIRDAIFVIGVYPPQGKPPMVWPELKRDLEGSFSRSAE